MDKKIQAEVSYTDEQNTSETITSDETVEIENVDDTPTGQPVIEGTVNGTATQNDTLTVNTNSIYDEDGIGSGGFSYQWTADGVQIDGANAQTLTLDQSLVGKSIAAEVSYTDSYGVMETIESNPTAAVQNVNDPLTGSIYSWQLGQGTNRLNSDNLPMRMV